MDIASANLIYFSPTQTTKKVTEGIAQGLSFGFKKIDLTLPNGSKQAPQLSPQDLAVIGFPVYSGRLPGVAVDRFRKLKGNGAPAVIVVVYGNRAYEDALLELNDLALEVGFKPIAAAAFIGEHSYSTNVAPIAVGRPNAEDLQKAVAFGKMVRDKLTSIKLLDQIAPLKVPGNYPYKEVSMLAGIAPAVNHACTACNKCRSVCPMAAINADTLALTDKGICIRCCACVKSCPVGARTMDDPRIIQVAEQLSMNCRSQKEHEMYL